MSRRVAARRTANRISTTPASARSLGLILSILSFAFVLTVVLALGLGAVHTPPHEVLQGLVQGDSLIWRYRFPRLLVGALAGMGMAVSGCLLQLGLRNPMAAPDTVGVTAGGGLAAVLVLLTSVNPPPWILTPAALFGSLVGAVIVIILSGKNVTSPVRLTLTGVAVSVGLAALTKLLLVRAAPEAGAAMAWLKGSLYARTLADALVTAPLILGAAIMVLLLARHLDILSLDDSTMAGIGGRAGFWRLVAIGLAIIASAGAVAGAGVLGFAGLIVPHAARMLVGRKLRRQIPVALLAGATLVVGCDAFGRWAFAPTEIPVGALISIVGAPYFIYLLLRLTKVRAA